jgi:hypothetical protein
MRKKYYKKDPLEEQMKFKNRLDFWLTVGSLLMLFYFFKFLLLGKL